VTLASEAPRPEPATTTTTTAVCANCREPLAEDQEWCLECGAARTLIHRAPDWRIAVGIVGAIVTIALVAFAIVLVNLSADSSQAVTTVTAATATVTAPTASAPASIAAQTFVGWPVGLSGWTVVLASSRTQAGADAAAAQLAAAGVSVGVLDSSQHPSMNPGYWFVFSGRYPDGARARAAATTLRAQGQPGARARRVAPPGGL
jgi:sporulation related protein